MLYHHRQCPICGRPATPAFRRLQVPILVNVTYPTRLAAFAARRGDMEMQLCHDCTTLFNATYDPSILTFDNEYDNRQVHSPRYVTHMQDSVERLLQLVKDLDRPTIVDIGCGQGDFLHLLAEKLKRPGRLLGFDPALRKDSIGARLSPTSSVVQLFPRMFEPADAPEDAVFVLRAVLGYFTAPVPFLAELRRRGSCIWIETASLEWIVGAEVVSDLYYEYFSYYTAAALTKALEVAGWRQVHVSPTFGGQYLCASARCDGPAASSSTPRIRIPNDAAAINTIRNRIVQASVHGRVAIWGAAGKGLNLLPMLDPPSQLIECVIDINPAKQGRFAPVTGHRIVAPKVALAANVAAAYVTNPIYMDEISDLVRSLNGVMELFT
jgi:hypothetical protein